MENLLPCPFCGGEGIVVLNGTYQTDLYYVVQCRQCGAKAKPVSLSRYTSDDLDREKAIKAWNMRRN